MADRTAPYPSYNYIVDIGGRDPQKAAGRIFRCFGLTTEIHVSEYRDGNERSLTFEKYPERTKSAT